MKLQKKPVKNQLIEESDLVTQITEHPYFQWVIKQRKYIPYASLAFLAFIIIAFRFITEKTEKTEANYLLAESYFSMIQHSIQNEAEAENIAPALIKLRNITDTYPELHSRYDGLIAQLLITQGNSAEARPYAERALSRTARDKIPFYPEFSRTTLLIEDNQRKEALEQALALQSHLSENASLNATDLLNRNFGDTLFAYNLLRIAMLKKELGPPEEELKAWKEWEQYANINGLKSPNNLIAPNAFTDLNKQIGEDNFTLVQYIHAREKDLLKSLKK